MNRTVLTSFAVLFLLSTVFLTGLAFNIQSVEASGTIYIRADGSVEGTTNIITTDYVTYILNGTINDSIIVEKSNIIIDGAAYTVQCSGTGFYWSGINNVTIKNTNIKNSHHGILLDSSSNNSISSNNITNSYYGIWLDSSSNNSISSNNITNNNCGIRLDSSSNNSISSNNITNNYYGTWLYSSSNNSISSNNITNNNCGIWLYSSSNNSISSNNITNNGHGIMLDSSSNNSISGNTFTNDGLYVFNSYQNSVVNNTVNVRPLVYLEGVSNYTVDDAGQVILVGCDNIRVEGLNLSRTTVGVELWETSNSTISGNNITNNYYGILLYSSSNYNSISSNNITNNYYGTWLYSSSNYNSISSNNITNSDYGIWLDSSSNNSISSNNITNNYYGIWLDSSSNNSISSNNITNHYYGIDLHYSSNNIISLNNIANNRWGIELHTSSNNKLYHNNFVDNTNQVRSHLSINTWRDVYPSGGNYWSNYTGVDLNHDGIGDTPHVIDANNTDHYPLMGMFHSFNTSLGKSINVISNSSVSGFMYESPGTIRFHVSNKTVNQTYGFCRVCVPYEVLSDPFNVTIDGANPTYWNYTLYDNGTHSWIYFEYEHSTREIVIIPEFPSLLLLPLFMIATLLAVIVYRRKHQTLNRKREV